MRFTARGFLLLLSVCGLASIASADTFTYAFSFENNDVGITAGAITGQITTDCNSCTNLQASDILSFQFLFDGGLAIQSFNNPNAVVLVGEQGGSVSGLSATPAALYFDWDNMGQGPDTARILFSNGGNFNDTFLLEAAGVTRGYAGGYDGELFYNYAINPGNPQVFANDPGCSDGCSIATFVSSTSSAPEPGTIALLVSGLAGCVGLVVRKRK